VKTECGEAAPAAHPVQQESIELPSIDRIQNLVRQAGTEVVQEGGVVEEEAGGEEAQAAGPPVHSGAVRGPPAPHLLSPCKSCRFSCINDPKRFSYCAAKCTF